MQQLQKQQQMRAVGGLNARPVPRPFAPRLSVRAQTSTLDKGAAASTSQPFGRLFNFSAGPAVLPLEVLQEAQADLINYKGTGMSVMEMSHRGKEFMGIAAKAEEDLRKLLNIPSNYKVLFLQGGASTQFSMIPLNFAGPEDTTDNIVTGSWSKKTIDEAKKFSKANLVAKGDNKSIPAPSTWNLSPDAKYVHYCDNETIQGVEFKSVPDVGNKVLVSDMSSNFVSKPVDVSKYGLIYAGAQKNVGPAGVTIVIVREDLVGKARPDCPTMLDYKTHAENESMYNTPPCYAMYVCGLVFEHLLKKGGLEAVYANNVEKAKILYDAIEASNGFYNNPVDPACRSLMNVPFTIPSNPELEKAFIKEAEKLNMVQLKGHRSVGGMRASIYNAMPLDGVKTLAAFMKDFQAKNV
ncbi:phosphoserine aminotransferase [Dunaliella salina]|uniref:Phosphoserine aminotransferase n=1 Tax=Dunaliella salina TaxID=3046 RepID=A0ABQ7G8K4_DUNSA|nr:phosphoserine aminotransferase [Dunaliella salina]|eukprot:KAF5830934.1 phosphoserine aminotransferase [Dunaliella salina]